MIDFFTEIIQTIKQNRLRAIMTGFSVAWGIFMLLVLLGAGNGLQHGMENSFKGISTNSMFVWGGQTQMAYDGIKPENISNYVTKTIYRWLDKLKALNILQDELKRANRSPSKENMEHLEPKG